MSERRTSKGSHKGTDEWKQGTKLSRIPNTSLSLSEFLEENRKIVEAWPDWMKSVSIYGEPRNLDDADSKVARNPSASPSIPSAGTVVTNHDV